MNNDCADRSLEIFHPVNPDSYTQLIRTVAPSYSGQRLVLFTKRVGNITMKMNLSGGSIVYRVKGDSRGGEGMADFEGYVAQYSRELTRLCMKLCGNADDAEDLFQDTWTRALEKLDRYDESRSFKSWLFAVCVNLYKNAGKSGYCSLRRHFATREEQERFLGSIPDTERDLDAYLDLYGALYTLPKKHRTVIILYYFKEFSQKEIAEILDIPEGTVKSRLNTAKKQLKRRLYDETHDR